MKKILLLIIGFMAFAINMNAETYTHKFKKDELTKAGGTVTLTGFDWTASSTEVLKWNTSGKGVQLGGDGTVCESYSLKTSAFAEYTIQSIKVETCRHSTGDAKLTIKAGDATSQVYDLTGSIATYTFECNGKGDIELSWSASKGTYFVSNIEIIYTIPASMVDIEEPVFKTPEGVYENQIFVEAEALEGIIYYTIDGTTPSYEEYHSDPRIGTTKRSGYSVLNETLKSSAIIKAMAVVIDSNNEEIVYKSDIVEAEYIVSETKPYIPVTEITTGAKYAIIANDSVADLLFGTTNGYLQGRSITEKYEKYVETIDCDAFTFTSTTEGYTIQDAQNRYMCLTGNDGTISFATEKPATGAIWSVTINEGKATIANGNSTIYYSAKEDIFGCYTAENVTAEMVLPSIHMLYRYPEYTVLPVNNDVIDNLQKITVTCNDGIAASSTLKLKASGTGINKTFTYEQVDENTLEFTLTTPVTTKDNKELKINIANGDIILNPSVLSMNLPIEERYGARTLVKYTLVGDAPAATIDEVVPADGATVEKLSYILFTFSKIPNKTENAEIVAKLYKEGSTTLIPFEYTTMKEDESGFVKMEQCGLKITEPIVANGTYILEIPEGYFVDSNGKNIAATTLKYIVENDGTGVEEIIAEGETSWVVYSLTGIKVLDTTNANELNALAKGIYIINGRKHLVK